MSGTLKGNCNFPTTIWAGPGRIAELPAACQRAGIGRPLVVTDQGLVATPMVHAASAALGGAPWPWPYRRASAGCSAPQNNMVMLTMVTHSSVPGGAGSRSRCGTYTQKGSSAR